LMNELFPKLKASTTQALWFNDKYENNEKFNENRDALTSDMSHIAESLSERFELEDRLIADLHARHRAVVA
jgi:regulator of sigma D